MPFLSNSGCSGIETTPLMVLLMFAFFVLKIECLEANGFGA